MTQTGGIAYRHDYPLDPVDVARIVAASGITRPTSDLAVDKALQGRGIGRELISRTQAIVGDEVSIILLSAPGAMSYYPAVGFQKAGNAFVIGRKR